MGNVITNPADMILKGSNKEGSLYLGSILATEPHFIRDNNINVVISMIPINGLNMIHYTYYVKDNISDQNKFKSLIPTITAQIDAHRKAKLNVLVHCRAGIHRAPAVVVHYLQRYKGMSLEDSFNLVRTKRYVAFINGSTFDLKK
jgi:hypothetical protein